MKGTTAGITQEGLQRIVDVLEERGLVANVVPVPYRDVKDAHHMLQVFARND